MFCCGCCEEDEEELSVLPTKPSNEELLRVAFLSFLGFTVAQLLAAVIAQSHAMMGDSLAMAVDCFTYGFNLFAERRKQALVNQAPLSGDGLVEKRVWERRIRKQRLCYELVPPLVSVICLFLITSVILRQAMETIARVFDGGSSINGEDDALRFLESYYDYDDDDYYLDMHSAVPSDLSNRDIPNNEEGNPSLILMLIFSTINLFVDLFNVTSFAKADHALGFNVEDRHLRHGSHFNDPDDEEEKKEENGISNSSSNVTATSGSPTKKKAKKRQERNRRARGGRYSTLMAEGEDGSDDEERSIGGGASQDSFQDARERQWSNDEEEDLQLEGADFSERMNNLSWDYENPTSKDGEPDKESKLEQTKSEKEPMEASKLEQKSGDKSRLDAKVPPDGQSVEKTTEQNNTKSNTESASVQSTNDNLQNEFSFESLDMDQYHPTSQTCSMDQANLNMCSAYTHVFVDTIRSMAVLLASLIAVFNPRITSEAADAAAAVVVSLAILFATIPLFIGLQKTSCALIEIRREEIFEREHSNSLEMGWKPEEENKTNEIV